MPSLSYSKLLHINSESTWTTIMLLCAGFRRLFLKIEPFDSSFGGQWSHFQHTPGSLLLAAAWLVLQNGPGPRLYFKL